MLSFKSMIYNGRVMIVGRNFGLSGGTHAAGTQQLVLRRHEEVAATAAR
jgi:hypothetical protein